MARRLLVWAVASVTGLLALAGPARAEVTYTFTSDQGDFVYDTPTYFSSGALRLDQLTSYSFSDSTVDFVDFNNAAYSNISLLTPTCDNYDNCFEPNFGHGNIFDTNGTYTDIDGSGAKLVISETIPPPVPEPPSVAIFLSALVAGLLVVRRAGRRRQAA